jgi:hypothetical protein
MILHDGVNYERTKFQQSLTSSRITLDGTNAWIGHSLGKVVDSTDHRVCFREVVEGVPASYVNFVFVAVIDVVATYADAGWHGSENDLGKVPEILLLDSSRIRALNAHFVKDVLSAIIMTTVVTTFEQTLPRLFDGAAFLNSVAAIQEILLQTPPTPGAPQQAIELVVQATPPTHQDSLRAMLIKNVKSTSAVYPVMSKVSSYAWYHFSRGGAVPASVRFPDCAKFLFPAMKKNAESLAAFVILNNKVHVMRYNSIITAAAKTIVDTRARNEQINAIVLEGDKAVENDGSAASG